jgi:hypothetical protein
VLRATRLSTIVEQVRRGCSIGRELACVVHAALLLIVVVAPTARASSPASPLLPPDHWAVDAAERMEALGLLPGWFPAQKAVPLLAVAGALAEAEEQAHTARPDLVPLVSAWRERLRFEWRGIDGGPLLGGRIGVGAETGTVRELSPRLAPNAVHLVPPPREAFATGGAAVRAGSHIAVGATGRGSAEGVELQSGEAVVALGGWSLSCGRARTGFGFSPTGGVMLSGAATLDRVELMTTKPLVLPDFVRRIGAWTLDTFVARLRAPRHPDHPLLWATSVRWRMHPRLTLGIQRAVMFGGDPWNGFPYSHRAQVLAGFDNYRENNMLTTSARWRLPTDAVLPLTVAVDWGTDDDPLAAYKIPGLVAGIRAPLVGSIPASVGVEYAFFGRLCCRSKEWSDPWYEHTQYVAGWTTGETPLGDALGGNGRVLRIHGSADPWRGRVRLSSVAWVQERFSENLYAPQAAGRGIGARGLAELRLGRAALELRGSYERGTEGWRLTQAAAAATLHF